MRCFHVVLIGALALGCRGNGDSVASFEAPGLSKAGPDPVAIRVPRQGGLIEAFPFARLDSAIWKAGNRTPPVDRILAFDSENGVLAFVDGTGMPGWIDLRLGTVRRTPKTEYTTVASADGWSIFAATPKNAIVRLTPTGDWRLTLVRPIKRLLPSTEGTLLVLTDTDDATRLLRLRPPNDAIADSATLPPAGPATLAPVGDRAYLVSGKELFGIAPNELERREHYRFESAIVAIAPTPSGDRVFVATQGSTTLYLVDRYAAKMRPSVALPGGVSELRMDPLGRYLLARADEGDSAWIVSISAEELVGAISTEWREDLPAVAIDGTIATLSGKDLAFVEPRTNKAVRTAPGGAAHLWFFVRWNGFRPRARGIDEPVSFSYERGDTAAVLDSSAVRPPPATDTLTPPIPVEVPVTPEPPPRARGWIVSFAAVLSLERAREIAGTISVNGTRPRVVTGETAGTTVYRVVIGPYDSREAADRAGRSARHSYWIYEDVP